MKNYNLLNCNFILGNGPNDLLKEGKEKLINKIEFNDAQKVNFKKLSEFYEKQFLKQSNSNSDYKFTAYIADRIFNKIPIETNCIVYPSIRNDKNSINYAITKNAADSLLSIEKVYMVMLKEYTIGGKMEFSIHKIGEIDMEEKFLTWRTPKHDELGSLEAL